MRPSTDSLKLERDGHLEYGKVPSSKHAWVRPVWDSVEADENYVYYTYSFGTIAYERKKVS